ncbi:MAG: DUF2752 domain-containing protein [Eubacterium sp.]|nr:DUF2752 domain-containing protein [Eubacterium sp.]MCM1239145.1 DUF2752 domain-containing protein [Lachnospiraceae bacterium]MCM1304683.1 DUF2752 domain-containing protein [Butyrivibrio sp.]MCM1412187.1 DUF2752 domain-containing protein [Lachnospiraceae bacterium]
MGLAVLAAGIPGVALYYGVVLKRFQMPPCVLYTYLHVYCPGCGGTRAVEALLHGRILESVWYHPVVLYTVIVFGGFMLTQSLERIGVRHIRGWKYHDWHLYGAVVVIACNFLMKNLLQWIWGITI